MKKTALNLCGHRPSKGLIFGYALLTLVLTSLSVAETTAQTTISTGHPTPSFLVGGSAVVLAPSLTITSSSTFDVVKVSVENAESGDVLAVTAISGYSSNYDLTTKTLTITKTSGSGSVSDYQNMLRSATFSTTNTTPTSRRIIFIMGNGETLVIGVKEHFYELVNNGSNISWTSAKTAAEAKTITTALGGTEYGYLATITSSTENEFIRQKVSANTWIGASDDGSLTSDSEGEWYWVTGPENLTKFWTGGLGGSAFGGNYESWADLEPNDSESSEDYAHLLGSSGTWNDYDNTTAVQYYIVEYGGEETSPNTIIATDYVDVTITTNTPPTATADTYNWYYTQSGVQFSVAASGVLGNDSDTDGPGSISVGNPRTISLTSGTVVLAANGSFTYTPNATFDTQTGANGFIRTESFTYYATDGLANSGSVTVTLNFNVPYFTGALNSDFNNVSNWNCGYLPSTNMNIIIATNKNMSVNENYTCKNLQFEAGASFICTNGSTLTITGDVLRRDGNTAIDVASPIKVNSSIQIHNP